MTSTIEMQSSGKEKGLSRLRMSSSNKLDTLQEKCQVGPLGNNEPSDYETAISSCGYGRFNYLLTLGFIPITCFSQLFVSGSTAYIMPAAECDLELTDFQKGTLNAAVFAGSIGAGVVWGALADKFGRRKLLVTTFFSDCVVSFACSFVHAFWLLLCLKLIGGIILAGPLCLVSAYLAETHGNSHRAQTIMWMGMGFGLAGVVQPVLAYLVIPLQIRVPLVPGVLDLTSWRIFLMMCSFPSFVAGVSALLLPETPKFLMSQGRGEEALRVFKRIYVWNTGNAPSSYPIRTLKISKASEDRRQGGGFQAWLQQFRTVTQPPYISRLILVSFIQMGMMLWMNYIRLWTPQLFHTLDEYDTLRERFPSVAWGNASNVCEKISTVLEFKEPNVSARGRCQPVSGDVYLRSMVTGAMITASYFITGPLIKRVGHTTIVRCCLPLAGAFAMGLNWAVNAEWMMGLAGMYLTLNSNSNNALSAVKVDLFPTSVRVLSMSIIMMCGRVGSVTGNLLLPLLLAHSCPALFWCVGVCLLVCGALAWLLPSGASSRPT